MSCNEGEPNSVTCVGACALHASLVHYAYLFIHYFTAKFSNCNLKYYKILTLVKTNILLPLWLRCTSLFSIKFSLQTSQITLSLSICSCGRHLSFMYRVQILNIYTVFTHPGTSQVPMLNIGSYRYFFN